MGNKVYETPLEALRATDEFYLKQEGFGYPEPKVTEWLCTHVPMPRHGRILDLCCGDGTWSKGIQSLDPRLELFGIDISEGAILRSRKLLKADEAHFVVRDAEHDLPFPDDFFELIFARGPGLYNQHSMDRPATIRVIEMWHRKLVKNGLLVSVFYSDPRKMGTYTSMEKAKLPYNRCPRRTEAVDFRGGKYHHTVESFLTPFWKAQNVEIVRYSFIENLHILVTHLRQAES